jgi:hypothetical protein
MNDETPAVKSMTSEIDITSGVREFELRKGFSIMKYDPMDNSVAKPIQISLVVTDVACPLSTRANDKSGQ